MTRIVERSETGPQKIAKDEIQGDAVWVCRCGLSKSQPFCDGSHKLTRDERPNVLFRYTTRVESPAREVVTVSPASASEVPAAVQR